jgi:hypothetical protein
LAANTTWKGVVMGPPGSGKTCFALGSALPTFAFDIDQGMNAAISHRIRLGLPLNNVVVWPVKTSIDFNEGMKYLIANESKFGLCVVDSATELQRMGMKEIADSTRRRIAADRDWQQIRLMMEDATVWLRYLKMHVVYTCHEIDRYNSATGQRVWKPSFEGKTATEYARHFSWIARLCAVAIPTGTNDAQGMPINTVVRKLNFGPDPYVEAKDRSTAMQQWEDPNLDAILSRMMASGYTPR